MLTRDGGVNILRRFFVPSGLLGSHQSDLCERSLTCVKLFTSQLHFRHSLLPDASLKRTLVTPVREYMSVPDIWNRPLLADVRADVKSNQLDHVPCSILQGIKKIAKQISKPEGGLDRNIDSGMVQFISR